jgi:hypothetical protein
MRSSSRGGLAAEKLRAGCVTCGEASAATQRDAQRLGRDHAETQRADGCGAEGEAARAWERRHSADAGDSEHFWTRLETSAWRVILSEA